MTVSLSPIPMRLRAHSAAVFQRLAEGFRGTNSESVGLTGAAWGLVAAAAVYAGVGLCLAGRMTGFDVAAIARRAWRPALGNAAMIATVVGAGGLLSQLGDAPRLMAVVGLGGTVYLVTVLAAWHLAGRPEGAESQVVVLALRRFRSRGAGAGSIP